METGEVIALMGLAGVGGYIAYKLFFNPAKGDLSFTDEMTHEPEEPVVGQDVTVQLGIINTGGATIKGKIKFETYDAVPVPTDPWAPPVGGLGDKIHEYTTPLITFPGNDTVPVSYTTKATITKQSARTVKVTSYIANDAGQVSPMPSKSNQYPAEYGVKNDVPDVLKLSTDSTISANPVSPGTQVTFTCRVTNTGTSSATGYLQFETHEGVLVGDGPLIPGTFYKSETATWAANETKVCSYTATVTQTVNTSRDIHVWTFVNKSGIPVQSDSNPYRDCYTVATSDPKLDINSESTVAPNPATIGAEVTFTCKVNNPSNQNVNGRVKFAVQNAVGAGDGGQIGNYYWGDKTTFVPGFNNVVFKHTVVASSSSSRDIHAWVYQTTSSGEVQVDENIFRDVYAVSNNPPPTSQFRGLNIGTIEPSSLKVGENCVINMNVQYIGPGITTNILASLGNNPSFPWNFLTAVTFPPCPVWSPPLYFPITITIPGAMTEQGSPYDVKGTLLEFSLESPVKTDAITIMPSNIEPTFTNLRVESAEPNTVPKGGSTVLKGAVTYQGSAISVEILGHIGKDDTNTWPWQGLQTIVFPASGMPTDYIFDVGVGIPANADNSRNPYDCWLGIPSKNIQGDVLYGQITITGGSIVKHHVQFNVLPDTQAGYCTTPSGDYNEGTQIVVTAVPYEGYRFDHWEGTVANGSTQSQITFFVTTDINMTAVFVPIGGQVTITFNVEPGGTTTAIWYSLNGQPWQAATDWQIQCNMYDYLSFECRPAPSMYYEFWYWLVDGVTDDSFTTSLIMNYPVGGSHTFTAVVRLIEY